MGLISELRRRNVFRMAVLYAVAAWLIMQVAEVLVTLASLPAWTGQAVLVVLLVGLPIALIFSWVYELTPEGISLEKDVQPGESITHITGRRLDFIVISLLCAAVMLFAYDKWWTSGPPVQSIAVLPFTNMSDESENEYFADGISEEILNELAKIEGLLVTSRSSAFSFKDQNVDIPTIASKLNVAHVLEGSVRKAGDQLRITAQLIDVEHDAHLWSETYDRKFENIFDIQEEIATAVVDALHVAILGDDVTVPRTDPRAYALYLEADSLPADLESQQLEQALILRALDIDPNYAPGWVELGWNYFGLTGRLGHYDYLEGYELARQAFERAIEIDPENAEAFSGLAAIEFQGYQNFQAANGYFIRALDFSSGNAAVLGGAAFMRRSLGRLDEAIDLWERALKLDPLNPSAQHGEALRLAGRLDEAEKHLKTVDNFFGIYYRAWVELSRGDPKEALEIVNGSEYRRKLKNQHEVWPVLQRAVFHHALGNTPASDHAMAELVDCCLEGGPYQVALARAYRGEIDEAFSALELAYEVRDSGMVWLFSDVELVNLHDDPRWKPFLAKVGFPTIAR